MNATIRVLIADDHPVVRQGIVLLLMAADEIIVVGEAQDGQEAVIQAELLNPDIILMDLKMPGMGGLEATRQILDSRPTARILILTGSQGAEPQVEEALALGASGYLPKKADSETLINTIRRIVHD